MYQECWGESSKASLKLLTNSQKECGKTEEDQGETGTVKLPNPGMANDEDNYFHMLVVIN